MELKQRIVTILIIFLLFESGCSIVSTSYSSKSLKRSSVNNSEEYLLARADAFSHFALGVIADLKGDTNTAIEEYILSFQKDPSNDELLAEFAPRLIKQGQTQQLYKLLSDVISSNRAGSLALAYFGQTCLLLGKKQEAINALEKATQMYPPYFMPFQMLADIALESGNEQVAISWIEKAIPHITMDPSFAADFANWINFQITKGRFSSFQAQLQKWILMAYETVLKSPNPSPVWIESVSMACQRSGLLKEAALGYEKLLEIFEEMKVNPLALGMIHERLIQIYGELEEKKFFKQHLEAIRNLNPTNPLPHFMLGMLALEESELEEAISCFQQVLILDPQFKEAYYRLVAAQLGAGRAMEALQTIEKARERFQEDFFTELYSGIAYHMLGRPADAIKYFQNAESMALQEGQRLTPFYYFQLATAYHAIGKWDETEMALKKAIELDPGYSMALNYLGYCWAEQGKNLEEALKLIQRAIEKAPDNAAYLDSLGWVLYKLNRFEEALCAQLKAVENAQEPDPILYEHLGDIYFALGKIEEAIQAWEKALEIEPSEAIVHKILDSQRLLNQSKQ